MAYGGEGCKPMCDLGLPCKLCEQKVDRDALLELADEFVEKAEEVARYIESSDGDFDRHAIDAMDEQYGYARRIREALGDEEVE